MALQSSTTTFQQGKNQLKGQEEVTRPAFSQEEASSNVILQEQISEDDQAENMPVLVTSTPSLEEQMQELQRKLAEREAEIANLATRLENREHEKSNEVSSNNTVITPQDIKELIAQGIREHQASMNPPVLGYRSPYPSHYDSVPFTNGYQN